MQIGSKSFTKDDIRGILRSYVLEDTVTYDGIVADLVKKQLLVQEARRLGLDRQLNYQEEVATYESLMAKNYLVDSTEIIRMAKEAYDRLQEEYEISHILMYLPMHATPEQQAGVYAKLQELRTQALEQNNFADLAKQFSDDKKTAPLGGYMGWFTGLQLIYPLENAVFATPAGGISTPVRTKYGYHIVRVNEIRSSRGRVVVQHILKALPTNATENYKTLQGLRIDSLAAVVTPANFEELAAKHSDDITTRDTGGTLPEFWTSSRQEAAFENAVAELAEGEVSKPVKTSSGWHLIKLKSRSPLPAYEELKPELIRKVTTDSRGEHIESLWNENARRILGFKPNESVINYIKGLANGALLQGNMSFQLNDPQMGAYLFAIDGISVPTTEFTNYVLEQQRIEKVASGYTPAMQMEKIYQKFEQKKLKEFREKNLSKVNTEFAQLKENFSNKILVQQVLEKRVFDKLLSDTVALRLYYQQHKSRFTFPDRIKFRRVASNDSTIFSSIQKIVRAGAPYRLNRGIAPLSFSKNSMEISEEGRTRLIRLASSLLRNPDMIVEIGGHVDVNEPEFISMERVKRVVEVLRGRGVDILQIREQDYTSTRPGDRFDWSKNQRVTFQFFSNNVHDLEKTFASGKRTMQIRDEFLSQAQFEKKYGFTPVDGQVKMRPGKITEMIEVLGVDPARVQSYREAQGEISKQYKLLLEDRLYAELKQRFPYSINHTEMRKAYLEEKSARND